MRDEDTANLFHHHVYPNDRLNEFEPSRNIQYATQADPHPMENQNSPQGVKKVARSKNLAVIVSIPLARQAWNQIQR